MSAPQGGDLGWTGRGAMVEPFERRRVLCDAPRAVHSDRRNRVRLPRESASKRLVRRGPRRSTRSRTPFAAVWSSSVRRIWPPLRPSVSPVRSSRPARPRRSRREGEGSRSKSGSCRPESRKTVDLGPSRPNSAQARSVAMTAGQVSAPLAVARGLAIVRVHRRILPPLRSGRWPAGCVTRSGNDVLSDRARQATRRVSARRVAARARSLVRRREGGGSRRQARRRPDRAGPPCPTSAACPSSKAILFGAGGTVGARGSGRGGRAARSRARSRNTMRSSPAKFEGGQGGASQPALLQQRRDQLTQGLIRIFARSTRSKSISPLVDERGRLSFFRSLHDSAIRLTKTEAWPTAA